MPMNRNNRATAPPAGRAARKLKVVPWKHDAMDILIRTDGVELTDKLHEAVVWKIGRVRQYAPRALRARVQLHRVRPNRSPDQFRALVHYEVPGNDLIAEHTAHEPVAAIDVVAEKIERRLRRRKTARLARRVREHRTQARRQSVARA